MSVPEEFSPAEVWFLRMLVDERILQAAEAGLDPSHSSSVFRAGLADKLRRWYEEEAA